MQNFARGWSFLKEAWQMAFKDKDLIKPTIYSMFAGFLVSIVFLIPMAAVGFLISDRGTVAQVSCSSWAWSWSLRSIPSGIFFQP